VIKALGQQAFRCENTSSEQYRYILWSCWIIAESTVW